MVNPDNTINSRSDIKRNSEKTSADKPEGEVLPDKFREVYAVYEHRKPKDEYEELDEVLKKRRKEGKGLASILEAKEESDSPVFTLKEGGEKEKGPGFENELEKAALTLADKEEKPVEKKPRVDFYLNEQPDIAQINPLVQPAPLVAETNITHEVAKPAPPTRNDLQEIIDKIVNQVYKLENSKTGESSIVIILNKEGPLKDVGIKISEFDSAHKQLNITVDNLTQEAKTLLDKAESQLLLALERKGYQVQQLTTTTQQDILRLDTPGQSEGEKGQSGENPRKRHREEEENPEKE